MTSPTLTSVATRVVGQYGQIGKLLVGSYRSGARRLAGSANTSYAAFLEGRSMPLVNQAVKDSLIAIEKRVVAFVEGGIVRGSDRAEQVIAQVADGVTRGIERVSGAADRVETAFGTKAISRVGGLSVPAAQVSLELATLALEGTKRLSARIADEAVVATPVKARAVAKKATRKSKTRA